MHVSDRYGEKSEREQNEQCVGHVEFLSLKLHQQREVQTTFGSCQVRIPGVRRRTVTGREPGQTRKRRGIAVVAARWCNSTVSGEVRHIGSAIVVFPAERN